MLPLYFFFEVFVKGRRMDFMAHPEEALHWGSQVFPSEQDFLMMAKSYLINNMGIKLPQDTNIMETLWFVNGEAKPHPGKCLLLLSTGRNST